MGGGVYANGKQIVFKDCGAVLETDDECYLPDGSTTVFPNTANAGDAKAPCSMT